MKYLTFILLLIGCSPEPKDDYVSIAELDAIQDSIQAEQDSILQRLHRAME